MGGFVYEYTFVNCALRFERNEKIEAASYQSEVRRHAAQGWRLVQILVELPAAVPASYILVLERPATA